jgi:uncharacterized protein
MRRAVLLALVVLTGFAARAGAQTYDALNSALVDAVVVPAYQAYAAATERLPSSIEALCAEADPERLEVAQQAWGEAMLAWQHAQTIRFGPVIDEGLAPQIEFWPDKHGTAGRQLSQALADRDPSLLDAGQLAGKSVGLTSQATLERLLFGQALQDPDLRDYACAYALAVARPQTGLAHRFVWGWIAPDGFRAAVASAGPGNEVFFSAYDPAVALYRSIADTLDGVIQIKLEPPLGESLAKARGKRAENWRSHMALPGVAANLATARDLYVTPGGFADLYAVLGGDPALDQEIRTGFEDSIAAVGAIPLPLVDAVGDPTARPQVIALVDKLKALRTLLRGPVANGLGLSIGFNATDGD